MATYTWGANGIPPDPPWTEIRSGLVQLTTTLISTSALGIIKYNATSFSPGQYSQSVFKISSADIFNGQQMLFLRMVDLDNYFVINFDDGRHPVTITSRIAANQVVLCTSALPANFILDDVAYVEITSDDIISVKRNGVTFMTHTATGTVLSGGNPGIGMAGATTDQGAWGDWAGGDLSSPGITATVGVLSATYDLRTQQINIGTNPTIAPLSATHSLITQQINVGAVQLVGVVSASYSLGSPTSIFNTIISAAPLSATYDLRTQQINTNVVASVVPLSASFSSSNLVGFDTTIGSLVSSASYSLRDVQVNVGANKILSVEVISASYSLHDAQTNGSAIIPVDIVSATYDLRLQQVNANSSLVATSLSGSYSLRDVQVNADSLVSIAPLSASISLKDTQTNGFVIIPVDIVSANYLSQSIQTNGSAIIPVDIVSATYDLRLQQVNGGTLFISSPLSASISLKDANVVVDGNSTIQVGVLSASQSLELQQISGNSSIEVNVVSSSYLIQSATIFGDASISLGILSADYSSDSTVVDISVVILPNILNGFTSIVNPTVINGSGDSIPVNSVSENYSIFNPQINTGVTVRVNITSATFHTNPPSIFHDSIFSLGVLNCTFDTPSATFYFITDEDLENYELYPAMPNQNYFQEETTDYDRESTLFSLLYTEAINMHGVPMIFYVNSFNTSYDKVFGEDNNRNVLRSFNVQAYYELPNEDEMWGQFSMMGVDNFHMQITMRHFAEASQYNQQGTAKTFPPYIPLEGDYLKARYNEYFYEIVKVKQQVGQYLKRQHVWDLIVRPMRDEKLSVSASIPSNDIIRDVQDIEDIFNVSDSIEREKPDKLYRPGSTETGADPLFGSW